MSLIRFRLSAPVAHLSSSESSLSSLVGTDLLPLFLALGHPDRLTERDREVRHSIHQHKALWWSRQRRRRRAPTFYVKHSSQWCVLIRHSLELDTWGTDTLSVSRLKPPSVTLTCIHWVCGHRVHPATCCHTAAGLAAYSWMSSWEETSNKYNTISTISSLLTFINHNGRLTTT